MHTFAFFSLRLSFLSFSIYSFNSIHFKLTFSIWLSSRNVTCTNILVLHTSSFRFYLFFPLLYVRFFALSSSSILSSVYSEYTCTQKSNFESVTLNCIRPTHTATFISPNHLHTIINARPLKLVCFSVFLYLFASTSYVLH